MGDVMWECQICQRQYDLTPEQWKSLEYNEGEQPKFIHVECFCSQGFQPGKVDLFVGLKRILNDENNLSWETFTDLGYLKPKFPVIVHIKYPRHPYYQDRCSRKDIKEPLMFACTNCGKGVILDNEIVKATLPSKPLNVSLRCYCDIYNPEVIVRIRLAQQKTSSEMRYECSYFLKEEFLKNPPGEIVGLMDPIFRELTPEEKIKFEALFYYRETKESSLGHTTKISLISLSSYSSNSIS